MISKDFQVQTSEGSDFWSSVFCIANAVYLSLLWPCWQPNLERALMFPSPPCLHCEHSPLKMIIDLTPLLRIGFSIYWRWLQQEI